MTSTPIDEIEAFDIASAAAADRGWPWLPPYWFEVDNGQWSITSHRELDIRIDAMSGSVIPAEPLATSLEPTRALALAREFALKNGQRWTPSFSLELTPTHWVVGASQSQFGGQLTIHVSHAGMVMTSHFNPK